MSKCAACDSPDGAWDPYTGLCCDCFSDWDNSTAYQTRVATAPEPYDEGVYQRHLADWLETRRRERINGFKEEVAE